MAFVLWLLVEGVTGRAATVARMLIIPFVVAYTALDSILGIAWGIAVESANDLPAEDQSGAGRLIDELISGDPEPRGLILYWGAGLLWLAVALAVVAALRSTAPLGAQILMVLGAAVWALGHAPPMGPVGMGLFLLGIAWTEFRLVLQRRRPGFLHEPISIGKLGAPPAAARPVPHAGSALSRVRLLKRDPAECRREKCLSRASLVGGVCRVAPEVDRRCQG